MTRFELVGLIMVVLLVVAFTGLILLQGRIDRRAEREAEEQRLIDGLAELDAIPPAQDLAAPFIERSPFVEIRARHASLETAVDVGHEPRHAAQWAPPDSEQERRRVSRFDYTLTDTTAAFAALVARLIEPTPPDVEPVLTRTVRPRGGPPVFEYVSAL
jgi:hypothetical protein